MHHVMTKLWATALVGAFCSYLSACSSFGTVKGNENGSTPVSQKEVHQYEKAVLKCYKTGGTRVVKIEGELRCF